MSKFREFVGERCGKVRHYVGRGSVAAGCMAAVAAPVIAQPTLPDPGIDADGYITLMVTTVGALLALVMGGALALWLGPYAVRKVKGWFK